MQAQSQITEEMYPIFRPLLALLLLLKDHPPDGPVGFYHGKVDGVISL
jgi:hypothetical protein